MEARGECLPLLVHVLRIRPVNPVWAHRALTELWRNHGYSQEDMIAHGFSARHWQQIEAGRPVTVTTLLRMCDTFRIPMAQLVRGMDKGLYGN